MKKQFIKDAFGWGVALWLIGYVLGMVLFFTVPVSLIGWIISPIGVVITLWVLLKKIHGTTMHYYLSLGIIWAIIAVMFDYFFLVQMLQPADGYYKLDVYLYYGFTLVLPLLVGYWKIQKASNFLQ